MLETVVIVALVLACLSFGVYFVALIAAVFLSFKAPHPSPGVKAGGPAEQAVGALMAGLSGFVEAMGKAHPAVAGLIASLIFLLIAAVCSWGKYEPAVPAKLFENYLLPVSKNLASRAAEGYGRTQ